MSHCLNCHSTRLVPRRVYRRGGLAVLLGHLLIVPAVLVVGLGAMGLIAPRGGGAEVTRSTLEAAGVPAKIAERVFSSQLVLEAELATLAEAQRRLVREAQLEVADGGPRGALERFTAGTGFPVLVAGAATSGLVGWFLIRKKRMAKCADCGASFPARAVT